MLLELEPENPPEIPERQGLSIITLCGAPGEICGDQLSVCSIFVAVFSAGEGLPSGTQTLTLRFLASAQTKPRMLKWRSVDTESETLLTVHSLFSKCKKKNVASLPPTPPPSPPPVTSLVFHSQSPGRWAVSEEGEGERCPGPSGDLPGFALKTNKWQSSTESLYLLPSWEALRKSSCRFPPTLPCLPAPHSWAWSPCCYCGCSCSLCNLLGCMMAVPVWWREGRKWRQGWPAGAARRRVWRWKQRSILKQQRHTHDCSVESSWGWIILVCFFHGKMSVLI